MGEEIEFEAVYFLQDGTKDEVGKSLGLAHTLRIDIPGHGRFFIDVTNLVNRAATGKLPTSGGGYYVDGYEKDDMADWVNEA